MGHIHRYGISIIQSVPRSHRPIRPPGSKKSEKLSRRETRDEANSRTKTVVDYFTDIRGQDRRLGTAAPVRDEL